MPPKKAAARKSAAQDDELDRKFEEKQKLIEKLETRKEDGEANKSDGEEDSPKYQESKAKENVFAKIKQVNSIEPSKSKAQKKKQAKESEEKKKEEQSKGDDEKKDINTHDMNEEVDSEEEEELPSDADDSSDEEVVQNSKLNRKKSEEEDDKATEKNKKKEKKVKDISTKKEKSAANQPQKDEEMFKSKESDDSHCDIRIVLFIVIALVLMVVFKTYAEKYSRHKTVSGSNLYSVLESEYSATQAELKAAYRRLSLVWHPDKNQNCGEKCREKFYEINAAWKILGNVSQRESYDSSHGILEMIKSKAILLDESNYESLVSQSTDVWIIQIFLNGDDNCIRMSSFWESTINKYGHVVKFGRIDAEQDYRLVSKLPFSAPIFPTFFSTSYHAEPALLSFASRDIEAEMAKFVQKSVANQITILKKENVAAHSKEMFEYQKNKKIDIVYIFSQDRIPIEFKYAALQNSQQFNFFTNAFGQAKDIEVGLRTRNNFLVMMNDEEKGTRVKHEFHLGRTFNADRFYRILNYLNFRVTPELGKENFKQYCRHHSASLAESSSSSSSYNDDDNNNDQEMSTLCVLLFKQSPHFAEQLDIVNKYRSNYKTQSVEKFLTGERMFENYRHIQFAIVDLDKHWKFRQVLDRFIADPKRAASQVNEKQKQGEVPLAIAFLEENKKIATINNIRDFEDWILDLQDDTADFEYLTQGIDADADVSSLFYFTQDTPFTLLLKSVRALVVDYKLVLAVLIGFPTLLFKRDAQFALIWTSVLALTYILGFAILETYQDFLYSK